MGAPKQKWTSEEEAALRSGVEKYGVGKWRAIQKDPKFGPILKSRSNVDLKDKWRNLSACAQPGHSRSSKVLGVGAGGGMRKPMSPLSMETPSVFPDGSYPTLREPTMTKPVEKSPIVQWNDEYIVEAVLGMRHPAGSSIAAIATYIEERHNPPVNFRKSLNARLKTLTFQGRLVKVDQNYKVSTGSSSKGVRSHQRSGSDDEKTLQKDLPRRSRTDPRSKKPRMDLEEANSIIRNAEETARIAVQAVAFAEATAATAELAAKEADAAEAELEAAEAAVDAAARPSKRCEYDDDDGGDDDDDDIGDDDDDDDDGDGDDDDDDDDTAAAHRF